MERLFLVRDNSLLSSDCCFSRYSAPNNKPHFTHTHTHSTHTPSPHTHTHTHTLPHQICLIQRTRISLHPPVERWEWPERRRECERCCLSSPVPPSTSSPLPPPAAGNPAHQSNNTTKGIERASYAGFTIMSHSPRRTVLHWFYLVMSDAAMGQCDIIFRT